MSILLLLLLTIACLPIDWPAPRFGLGPEGSAVLAGSVVVMWWIIARLSAGHTLRRLALDPDDAEAIACEHRTRRSWFFLSNIAAFAFLMLVGGWAWTVREMLTVDGRFLPGAELLTLAPYFAVQIGSWSIFYDVERALCFAGRERGSFWSRSTYLLFLIRSQTLMVFIPLAFTIGQLGLVRQFPHLIDSSWAKVAALVSVLLISVLLPTLLPLMLGLRRMPPSFLRSRLEATAQRLGVRYRHLYVWNTHGNVATAMVTGLVPWLRHIVFTDLVLETMPADEIESILGHEVGHVRHGHLLYYPIFLILSFLAIGALYRGAELLLGTAMPAENWALVLSVAITGGYLLVIFGFVSRRCERQADVFGCRAMSCANPDCAGHDRETVLVEAGRGFCRTGVATFVRALERVEAINGLTRLRTPSKRGFILHYSLALFHFLRTWLATWQHSTIARRVAYLRWLAEDPRRERHFQRRMNVLRWGLVVLLIALAGSMVAWNGWELMG